MRKQEPARSFERAVIGVVVLLAFVVLFEVSNAISPSRPPTLDTPELSDQEAGLSETLQARVTRVLEERPENAEDLQQLYQKLELEITHGSLKGQHIVVEQGLLTLTSAAMQYKTGDQVLVEYTHGPQGDHFVITDFIRLKSLFWLGVGFALITLLVGRWRGLFSLIGTAFSFVVILRFILPQILAGRDPVLVSVVGSVILMGCTLYIVYGWEMQTHAAAGGLFLSLVLTALLAALFVNWSRLSGFSTDEATFLMMESSIPIDPRGLLLSGIIIGALGVLDDIAVGQASAIFRLSAVSPDLDWRSLFEHGMKIGRDHIAGMVNTLVLAYVGASLPFMLLFSLYSEPFLQTVNRGFIAEEIVRTLVGSMGLIATVPLTSLLASWLAASQATGYEIVDGEHSATAK